MSRLATILLLPVLAAACAIIPPKLEGISQRNMEDAVLSMATAALRTGQVETARRLYRRLLEVDPESVAARMGLGNVSLRRQDPALAARWYLLALARAVEPAERHAALLAHGRAALSAGQVDAARDSFVRLTDPREGAPPTYVAWGYNGLGLAHILSGDAWGAVAAIERAVLTAPEEPRFQGNLDRALAMLPAAGAEQLRSGEPTGKPLPEADAGASNPAAIRPEAPAAVSAPVAATDPAGGQPRPVADADRAPQVPAPPEQAAPDLAPLDHREATPTGATDMAERTPPGTDDLSPSDLPRSAPAGYVVLQDNLPFLQFGAYLKRHRADEAAAALESVTDWPVVTSGVRDGDGAGLHRVRIGPIPWRDAVSELIDELAPHGFRISNPSAVAGIPSAPFGGLDAWPVDENGVRFLQVGAFGERPVAESIAAAMRSLTDREVRVSETAQGDGALLHRVRIGPVEPGVRLPELFRVPK